MTTGPWLPRETQMQFHVLSFEGPDAYARAGGIASRVTGLTQALAMAGFETHLWFISDPDLPGHEISEQLRLHRWCQWISRYHPAGVYDGEEGKHADYVASLPPFLLGEVLLPHLQRGGKAGSWPSPWRGGSPWVRGVGAGCRRWTPGRRADCPCPWCAWSAAGARGAPRRGHRESPLSPRRGQLPTPLP